ncbi:MAG TPA: hypothetical protein VMW81_08160 [Nitrospinota bacterium]|nr:hypothetical protein [Nitrospinota bacterium]
MSEDLFNDISNQNKLYNLEFRVAELEKKVRLLDELIEMQMGINAATIETFKTISHE